MSASRVLVYGGSGVLGRSILEKFSSKGWITYSADMAKYTAPFINNSFAVDNSASAKQGVDSVSKWLDSTLEGNKLNCIVNAAGGFMMGDISSDLFYDQLDTMWKVNSLSAFQSATLAQRYLCNNSSSLLVLTGAAAALNPTPIMLAYGTSKVVVHHLIRTLAVSECMPNTSKTIGIIPITIDTPSNRQAMPDANFNDWTKPEEFAQKVYEWSTTAHNDVANGGLYQFETKNGTTTVTSC